MSSSPPSGTDPYERASGIGAGFWEEASEESGVDDVDEMMNDALEEMVAQAEAQDELEGEYDEEEDDAEFFPPEDEEEVYVDFDEEEEEPTDDDAGEGEGEVIDLRDLLQAAVQQTMGGEQDHTPRTRNQQALQSIGIAGLRQLLRAGGFTLRSSADDDDDDDDEDQWYGTSRNQPMHEFWDKIISPIKAGQELELGGEFGQTPKRPLGAPASAFAPSRNIADLVRNRAVADRRVPKAEMKAYIPNSNGTEVARYPARCYCGQYSEDSSFFYTCTQDFRVQMYDTAVSGAKRALRIDDSPAISRRSRFQHFGSTQYTSLKPIKTIQGRQGNWTITDANLSPDNQWMIYSSITPYVHLVPTREDIKSGGRVGSDNQVMLDFSNAGDDDIGIWSIRFSGDSREIVAGAHFGDIYVYDIEARRRVLRVEGHSDDVNGVAFADSASSNVLISGSDDSFVKVWDRRSLRGGKPAGVLPGHTEGVTFVAPKGDGRYCISNGKDQSTKLWDLRKMMPSSEFESMPKRDYGLRNWDYRNMFYRRPRFASHPNDCSVMTYRGHAVLKTLIRCHFSPSATTGQKYIYSGSADGKIHIWGLDGRVVQVLDRAKATPLYADQSDMTAADSSAPERPTQGSGGTRRSEGPTPAAPQYRRGYGYGGSDTCTVRDVSWHSSEPAIMSTAWDGPDGQSGSIAKHEWKGYGKNGLSLEDAIERSELEAAG